MANHRPVVQATPIAPAANSSEVTNVDESHTADDKCPTSGREFHPIEAVRSLGPEMESAFPIPSSDSKTQPAKRWRIVRTARCMTSDDMMSEVKEREQERGKRVTKDASITGKKAKNTAVRGLYVFSNYGCLL